MTIPLERRRRLGLKRGDLVTFVEADKRPAILDCVAAESPFELVQAIKREVRAAAKRVIRKDALSLANARKARADCLVTLATKHLPGKPELAEYVRAPLLTPPEAFERPTQSD